MERNMKIEVHMDHPLGPCVIAPVDDPAAVEKALPPGWTVGDGWWASSPDQKQPDGRWLLFIYRDDDIGSGTAENVQADKR